MFFFHMGVNGLLSVCDVDISTHTLNHTPKPHTYLEYAYISVMILNICNYIIRLDLQFASIYLSFMIQQILIIHRNRHNFVTFGFYISTII